MTVPPAQPAPSTRREARAARTPSRAGRNLPAAVGVGLGLGAVVLASLVVRKEAFVVLVAAAVVAAVYELSGALRQRDITVPVVPVAVGAVAMVVAAFTGGGQALAVCFALTVAGLVLWRCAEGTSGSALRDVAGGMFVATYLPLLGAFTVLLVAPEDGVQRVVVYALVTVSSDVGGYAAGVFLGRHPMAPTVSPKKSWEGFAGSVVACAVVGAVAVGPLVDAAWWVGALLGALVALVATLGDLSESMLKRDLGIKDMGAILPGHGGVMDRLDSLVLAAPVVWVVLTLLAPA